MKFLRESANAIYGRGEYYTIRFNKTETDVLLHYKYITINPDGNMHAYRAKPVFKDACWKGNGLLIGQVEWDLEYLCNLLRIPVSGRSRTNDQDQMLFLRKVAICKTLIWTTFQDAYFDFDRIFRSMKCFDTWKTQYGDKLVESRGVKISFVDGDDVEIPVSYKFIAVDANGDVCVFKDEPELDDSGKYPVFKGKAKAQVGVAVWNWAEIDGSPKDFESAAPKVGKIMPDFKYEIYPGFKIGDELDQTGKFKIIFPKYSDIERLQ